MSPTETPNQQKLSSHGGFITGYSKNVQDRYAARTVANSGAYLLPHLDRLNSSGGDQESKGKPSFTFLDVGCGPGSITVDFAQRYPQAFFVGVDPGSTFVDAARARAAQLAVENVVFVQGNVEGLQEAVANLPADVLKRKLDHMIDGDSSQRTTSAPPAVLFDFVSCHQVISHLPPAARPRAVQNMHAMAKKTPSTPAVSGGGLVAIREAELETLMSISPSTPLLRAWHELLLGVFEENHDITDNKATALKQYPYGRNAAGRHLVRIALDSACFTRAQIRMGGSLNTHAEPDERRAWVESVVPMMENVEGEWHAKAVRWLLRNRHAGDEQGAKAALRDMVAAWKQWQEDDTAWLGIGSCEIVCQC